MVSIIAGRPALVLAPMEGVTDAPMRALLTERGGFSFCVSEFFRISQDLPRPGAFAAHIPELRFGGRTPAGVPVQVQLLGGDPEKLAVSAQRACLAGAPGIDLNFGCPAPTVNRHDGGATLLKYPRRIREIVTAVRAAVPRELPVSAKLRLGWDSPDPVHENAEMAAQGGASWITIHGRTKEQGYRPPALWEPIGEVRARLGGLPVVANGDLWSLDDFRRCRDVTGCEHFMIGRGALADPMLPLSIARELGLESACGSMAPTEDWAPLLQRFAHLCAPEGGKTGYVLCRTKQWLRMAGQKRSLPWLESAKRARTFEELLASMS